MHYDLWPHLPTTTTKKHYTTISLPENPGLPWFHTWEKQPDTFSSNRSTYTPLFAKYANRKNANTLILPLTSTVGVGQDSPLHVIVKDISQIEKTAKSTCSEQTEEGYKMERTTSFYQNNNTKNKAPKQFFFH